jgi:hypothetical protein
MAWKVPVTPALEPDLAFDREMTKFSREGGEVVQ